MIVLQVFRLCAGITMAIWILRGVRGAFLPTSARVRRRQHPRKVVDSAPPRSGKAPATPPRGDVELWVPRLDPNRRNARWAWDS